METVLDLFAGAGGFSLGLKWGGLTPVGAVEADRFAAQTFRGNFPGLKLLQRTVESCDSNFLKREFSGVDVIAGGPPCQGFSVAGPRQYGCLDERNNYVFEMARAARALKPACVLVENVRGLLTGSNHKGTRVLQHYLDLMNEIGYKSEVNVLQALNFGVPQFRERAIIVSVRSDVRLPQLQAITGRATPAIISTVEDALSDLPPLQPGEGTDELQPYASSPVSSLQELLRNGSEGVYNHVAMHHTSRIVERLKNIKPGFSLKSVAPEFGQRERNTHRIDGRGRYKMNCTRLCSDKPSIGLPANFQTIHVHPLQDRMLTAREGARLQSFPDNFLFMGPRTNMSRKLLEREGRHDEIGLSQYKQVGNAVPPLMAKAIAEVLLERC
jgi:DNA (cytosine-5)-methyltransferase 1